jgi:hypothetical protein
MDRRRSADRVPPADRLRLRDTCRRGGGGIRRASTLPGAGRSRSVSLARAGRNSAVVVPGVLLLVRYVLGGAAARDRATRRASSVPAEQPAHATSRGRRPAAHRRALLANALTSLLQEGGLRTSATPSCPIGRCRHGRRGSHACPGGGRLRGSRRLAGRGWRAARASRRRRASWIAERRRWNVRAACSCARERRLTGAPPGCDVAVQVLRRPRPSPAAAAPELSPRRAASNFVVVPATNVPRTQGCRGV